MIPTKHLGWLGLFLFSAGCTPNVASAADPGFALVELFTSEGCSSCPPADLLLSKIASDAKKENRPIYTLSFHVDYWNRLGWTDPYSAAKFTRRQQDYAQTLRLSGIYTPQMIVNGTAEFVGSNRANATKAIEAAIVRKASTMIDLKAKASPDEIVVEYKLSEPAPEAVLHFAWTEAEVSSNPDRGENGGQKLRHVNVVRDFKTIELKAPFSGSITLQRPDNGLGSVIAYVQEPRSGKIIGANAIALAAAK